MFHLAGSAVLAVYTMNLTHRTVKSITGPLPSTLEEKDVSKKTMLLKLGACGYLLTFIL